VLALIGNTVVVRALGSATPQLAVGPLSLAPYFLAAALALVAVALDIECVQSDGLRALGRLAIGLGVCAVVYMGGLSESGTVAILALGTAAVLLVSGPPLLACAAMLAIAVVQSALQSSALIETIRPYLPRVAERLLVWTHRTAAPDQLLRVGESLQFSGALGHAGAARLRFLVGPEVAKDYAPALIAVQGGWIGLALVLTGSVLLLVELSMGIRRTSRPIGRALQTAALALVIANLLVTTLWLGGATPFAGVPLPLLARAGSHLTAFAWVLLAYDAVSQADRTLERRLS
jgi:cell division protein FtsW (lipid II flippase)